MPRLTSGRKDKSANINNVKDEADWATKGTLPVGMVLHHIKTAS